MTFTHLHHLQMRDFSCQIIPPKFCRFPQKIPTFATPNLLKSFRKVLSSLTPATVKETFKSPCITSRCEGVFCVPIPQTHKNFSKKIFQKNLIVSTIPFCAGLPSPPLCRFFVFRGHVSNVPHLQPNNKNGVITFDESIC